MYDWRRMSEEDRAAALALRKTLGHPWHGPPHVFDLEGAYHLSAACYEHAPFIGASPARMAECERGLLEAVEPVSVAVHAWCILPNHYHLIVEVRSVKAVVAAIGRFHGRTSFEWNGQDGARGRQVWHRCSDRLLRSESHFWAAMNYVHHNPVRHGYVQRWEEWPFSSARRFLAEVGRAEAARIWRAYPLLDFGRGWDEPGM